MSGERSQLNEAELERLRDRVIQLEKKEDALRKSEERDRILLASLPQKIFFKDNESVFVKVNRSFAAEVGATPEELVGKTDLDLYPRELAEKYRADDQRVMESRRPVTLVERHTAAGQERFVEVIKAPVIDDAGEVVGLFGLFTDVTDRVEAEASLQRQAKLLAEQAEELERRNAELSRAYAGLQEAETQLIHSEKIAAIGQLVAGLAHEINNPASFVQTNLAVIERDVEDLLAFTRACLELADSSAPAVGAFAQKLDHLRDEHDVVLAMRELRELIESSKRGMNRIRDLVANLRSYCRVDTSGGWTMADLKEGLAATLVILGPIIPKGVGVRLPDDELPLVECNIGHINQVFMNLFVNAIFAVGGEGTITVRAERERDGLLVAVRDSGPGIPASIRSKIFDPFFTTKPVGKGTGLGLSIARRIIEAHNGTIDFESDAGGTEFRVWLPLRQRKGDE